MAGDRPRSRDRLRGAVGVLLTMLLIAPVPLIGVAGPAQADDQVAFTLDDARITESSGLAADTCGNRYWTANDSGDQGVAYAISPTGEVEGTLTFPVVPRDVEAVAVHDCRLYLADIGDNEASRDQVTIYWFSDPAPGQARLNYRSYDFRYPDGPHDAETFMIDSSGRFYVVTKEATGGIYRAPSQLSVQGVNELQRVGDAPAFVTDGVMVEDRMVLRTYVSVVVLDDAYAQIASAAIPLQQQGESISRTLDGEGLLLGSEGRPAPVLRIAMPTTSGPVPDGTDAPPPSPGPSATEQPGNADDVPAQTEAGDAGSERTLTWLALGSAALLAVLAAGAAFLVGSRRASGRHSVAGAHALPRRLAVPDPTDQDPTDQDPTDQDPSDPGPTDPAPAEVQGRTGAEGTSHGELSSGELSGGELSADDAGGGVEGPDDAPAEGAGPVDTADLGIGTHASSAVVPDAVPRPRRAAGVAPLTGPDGAAAPAHPAEESAGLFGGRFDVFFRAGRRGAGRLDAATLAGTEPAEGARARPAADSGAGDVGQPDVPDDAAGSATTDAPPTQRRPAARVDLDPATRAWLDAAFDASRSESGPRRALEE